MLTQQELSDAVAEIRATQRRDYNVLKNTIRDELEAVECHLDAQNRKIEELDNHLANITGGLYDFFKRIFTYKTADEPAWHLELYPRPTNVTPECDGGGNAGSDPGYDFGPSTTSTERSKQHQPNTKTDKGRDEQTS